jgi:hypothetical protein
VLIVVLVVLLERVLRVDGLTELTELRELQLLLLDRIQQLLLTRRRVQGVVLLAVGLRVAGHLVVHGRGRTVAVSIHLSVSTDYVRVSTRAMIHQRMRRESVLPGCRICTLDD